jgi:hypothetical protein
MTKRHKQARQTIKRDKHVDMTAFISGESEEESSHVGLILVKAPPIEIPKRTRAEAAAEKAREAEAVASGRMMSPEAVRKLLPVTRRRRG